MLAAVECLHGWCDDSSSMGQGSISASMLHTEFPTLYTLLFNMLGVAVSALCTMPSTCASAYACIHIFWPQASAPPTVCHCVLMHAPSLWALLHTLC